MIHEFNYTYEFIKFYSDTVYGVKVINEVHVNVTATQIDDPTVTATKQEWVSFRPYDKVQRVAHQEGETMLPIENVTNDIALQWAVDILSTKEEALNNIFTALIYGEDYVLPPIDTEE